MNTWIWIVGALLLGAILGGLAAFLIARLRWADAARAEQVQREFDGYRQEVSDHFVHTAELVNNLTRSYKAVYDHLERGAYRLVDEETLRKQLDGVNAESVQLEYIGRRDATAVLGSGAAASWSQEPSEETEPIEETEPSEETESEDTESEDTESEDTEPLNEDSVRREEPGPPKEEGTVS